MDFLGQVEKLIADMISIDLIRESLLRFFGLRFPVSTVEIDNFKHHFESETASRICLTFLTTDPTDF